MLNFWFLESGFSFPLVCTELQKLFQGDWIEGYSVFIIIFVLNSFNLVEKLFH